ncbi:hypothetical protein [Kluyvera intermedia]|uniref:hypothetical protein n=1 Tax=Kluyvera intermedia TaxID=61648 RepID=UPI00372D83AE
MPSLFARGGKAQIVAIAAVAAVNVLRLQQVLALWNEINAMKNNTILIFKNWHVFRYCLYN